MPNAGEAKAPWHQRKGAYLHKLCHENVSSLLVSAADKLHNARTFSTEVLTTSQGKGRPFSGSPDRAATAPCSITACWPTPTPSSLAGSTIRNSGCCLPSWSAPWPHWKPRAASRVKRRGSSLSFSTKLPASVCTFRTQRNPELWRDCANRTQHSYVSGPFQAEVFTRCTRQPGSQLGTKPESARRRGVQDTTRPRHAASTSPRSEERAEEIALSPTPARPGETDHRTPAWDEM